jgi:hypothetical protein
VVSARVSSLLSLRLSAENLTDQPIRYFQGPEVHRRYNIGRTFAVQVSVTK